MTCDRIRPLLSDYHDDALSPGQRARVRAHVAGCAACRAVLEGYDRLYAALRHAPAPAPADLRRAVYAGIAGLDEGRKERARQIAARPSLSPLAPFGPNVWGMLRAAGGTAALLAVLGGLVVAAMRVASVPGPGKVVVSAQSIAAAETAAADMVGELGSNRTARLPAAMQTAIAPVHGALAGAVALTMTVGRGTSSNDGVHVPFSVVRHGRNGAPRALVPLHAVVSSRPTPVVKGMYAGRAVPFPTIAPDEGLAYLHEYGDTALQGHGNVPADVAFHPFVAGATRVTLATPVTDTDHQVFTGLTVARDGRTLAYSVKGQGALGGVFGIDLRTLRGMRLLPLPDAAPPDAAYGHVFVKQVYAAADGRLLLAVVHRNEQDGSAMVTIDVADTARAQGPTTTTLTTRLRTLWQYWYNYVAAPDGHALAWTDRTTESSDIGVLKVSTLTTALGTRPTTVTIGMGAHPVWSPDGTEILYRRDKPAGLYVWSARGGSRRVVPLDSVEQPALDNFAWAPNGRYFAYVLRTARTSMVRLGDVDAPGYTWPAFDDKFIGPIAWVNGPTPAAATVAAGTDGAANAAGAPASALTPSIAQPAASAPARPPFASTDSPADVLHSFYNAINRREYGRAFGYLAVLPGDVPDFAVFKKGYATTLDDSVSLYPAPYINEANYHAVTCVGVAITARQTGGGVKRYGGWYMARSTTRQTGGGVKRYGGWYMARSTTGQAPVYRGWQIVMDGSRITEGGRATIPPQARCVVPSKAASSR